MPELRFLRKARGPHRRSVFFWLWLACTLLTVDFALRSPAYVPIPVNTLEVSDFARQHEPFYHTVKNGAVTHRDVVISSAYKHADERILSDIEVDAVQLHKRAERLIGRGR